MGKSNSRLETSHAALYSILYCYIKSGGYYVTAVFHSVIEFLPKHRVEHTSVLSPFHSLDLLLHKGNLITVKLKLKSHNNYHSLVIGLFYFHTTNELHHSPTGTKPNFSLSVRLFSLHQRLIHSFPTSLNRQNQVG